MKRILYIALFIFIYSTIHAQTAKLPKPRHRFIVIAHRGDHTEVPENTLAAYQKGIENGVDYVEIDLRTTKDGVLVIMHDETVDRMTNGKGKVSDLSYAEIKKLRITDKSKPNSKAYEIPSFEEVLKACRNKIHIYLDYKNADVAETYRMITRYGMQHQMIVYINNESQFRDWRKLVPTMPLMLSMPDQIRTPEDLKHFLSESHPDLLDGDYNDYSKELVSVATEAGMTAWPDIQSQNESINWQKALDKGFKGLQTDHPEALIEFLQKKGLR